MLQASHHNLGHAGFLFTLKRFLIFHWKTELIPLEMIGIKCQALFQAKVKKVLQFDVGFKHLEHA